jgi:hypothetical protein
LRENFALLAEMKTEISEIHWISVISVGAEIFPKLKIETMGTTRTNRRKYIAGCWDDRSVYLLSTDGAHVRISSVRQKERIEK